MEKSLRMENQKRKKVTGKKKKKRREKKNRPKEERKSTILSRKEKTFFVYVDSLSCSSARFPVFSIFAVVFLCLWQLCSLLCRPPQRSLSDRDIKKGVSNGLLYPGNLDPSSLTPGGPVVLLVWGFKRRRDNLLAWRELFANLYELKSCIRFWEEYNHFERIYRVFRFDRFLSNFAKTFRE